MLRCIATAGLFLALLLLGGFAFGADAPGRVVLLLSAQDTPTARRLKAELAGVDARVVAVRWKRGEDPSDQEAATRLAREHDANATVVLSAEGDTAVVWLWDLAGTPEQRTVYAGTGSAELRSEAIVVGTLELVRAHLLALESPPEPDVTDAPVEQPEPAPPEPGRFALAVSLGPDFPGEDWSVGLGYQFDLDARVLAPLGLKLLVRLPIEGAHVTDATAEARADAFVLGGAVTASTELVRQWHVGGYAGGGATYLSVQGFSDAPAMTRTAGDWVGVFLLGAHVRWQFYPTLGALLHAGAAIAPSSAEVVLNGSVVAKWGQPGLFSGLGLEFRPSFL